MVSDGEEKVPSRGFKGRVRRGGGIARHRKGHWKDCRRASTSSNKSASSGTDASEKSSLKTTCKRPLDEAHFCSASEEDFPTTASEFQLDTSDEDVDVVEFNVPKKKRRRTFLSRQRKRCPRTIGFINIEDGISSESESESESNDEELNQQNTTSEEKILYGNLFEGVDWTDFDIGMSPDGSACGLPVTAPAESDSNISSQCETSQRETSAKQTETKTSEPFDSGIQNEPPDDPRIFSGSSASGLSVTVPDESDSNISSQCETSLCETSGKQTEEPKTSEPFDSGIQNEPPDDPRIFSGSSSSGLFVTALAESDSHVSSQCESTYCEVNADQNKETKTSEPDAGIQKKPSVSDPGIFVSSLMDSLKLLLPKGWQTEILENNVLRMMKLNTTKNAAVQSCVYYDHASRSVGVFVHGMPVPRENRVFDCQTVPDSQSIGSLADYLFEMVTRLQKFKVCAGIDSNEDLWESARGFLDYSLSVESPCFRNAQCLFLINSSDNRKICFCCQAQIQKFEREKLRKEKEKEDCPTLRDVDLSKEAIIAKKDKYRKMHKQEKKRADRLQKRADSLQIKLDEVLKDDLSSILRVNQHKMTPLQRLFWESQLKILSLDDKRGMRWHPMLIRLALYLHSLSDSAYEFINESQIFTLPSSRRLFDYSHFIQPQEGCQQELTDQLKEKILKCGGEDHHWYVNLMFDEINIRSGLVFSRSTGELIGYTKLSGVEEELKRMQDEISSKTYKLRLAKKVLVFMAQGITSDVKDVVAVFSTDDLSASQLYDRTWEVIYHLEESDIRVLTLTFDGASVNRKFILMHERLDKLCNHCYSTKNLAGGSRPLFFILDPPHLLKAIRNALANSFAHKKTRKLWKNNQYLSWKVIEALFEATKDQKFRGHKLTKAHVKLTSFSCMTVLLATQTLSNSTGNCIEELSSHDLFQASDTSELVLFIRKMNRFFDCVNGKDETGEGTNPDKFPFTSSSDDRLNFLEDDFLNYFEEWKTEIINRKGIFTNEERSRMIISHQALGAIQVTVKAITGAIRFMLDEAGAPSVCARVFNQDPLEQYFGKIRRKHGDNRNPTLKSVHDDHMNIHAQGSLSLASRKGNTSVSKRKDFEVDSTPLPSRKVPRRSNE